MLSLADAAKLLALCMFSLWVQACIFRALHRDPPFSSRIFGLRRKLERLAYDGVISTQNPHFHALYRNVDLLFNECRRMVRARFPQPEESKGRRPRQVVKLRELPREPMPAILEPIAVELRDVLEEVVAYDFGFMVAISRTRRGIARMQKEHARQLLSMMPNQDCRLTAA